MTLSGNVYYRDIRTDTLNGDINEDSLDQSVYQPSAAERAALAAAGYTGFPTSGANAANTPFPYWRCIANALLSDEPGEKCNGLINRARHRAAQRRRVRPGRRGATALAAAQPVHGRRRRSTAARVGFVQSTELGYLNPDRSITGVGAFGDGVTGGERRRRAVRHARRSRRRTQHLERLRDRHAVARRTRGTSRSRAATTARRSTIAIASSPAAARARSTAITRSAASTRRPA